MYMSEHCERRVLRRLRRIVSADEVQGAVAGVIPQIGETWVLVKRLPRSVYIPCDTHDKGVNGDVVWAVVKKRNERDHGAIVTVMLRRSGQVPKTDYVITHV